MSIIKTSRALLVCLLLVWSIEAVFLLYRNAETTDQIRTDEVQKQSRLTWAHKARAKKLEQEYVSKKHLASGETVFDRVFNTQEQSISDLIERVSQEAFPSGWSCEVKVEEFTHFILLVSLPRNAQPVPFDQLTSYLQPLFKYCSPYLSSVAVFDRKHKSYLFFDETMLDEIKSNEHISHVMLRRAEQQGRSFTRFNSVTIECEKRGSHLFLPIEVAGPSGVIKCLALFDTGASTTMFSNELISATGYENLLAVRRRRFSTANGFVSCPIVLRSLVVRGFQKTVEVAVNERNRDNLLGMDFFEGMEYIVDFQSSAIYMWEKEE